MKTLCLFTGENTLALVDALLRSPYLVQPGEYHKGERC